MKRAVCALIYYPLSYNTTIIKDKVIGVSRKNDPFDFGLPGGKVDPGETDEEAVIREVKEETGLIVRRAFKIFERTDDEFICSTFYCIVEGTVVTIETGLVKPVSWETLFAGSFGEYNKTLYENLWK